MRFDLFFISTLSVTVGLCGCKSGESNEFTRRMDKCAEQVTQRFDDAGKNLQRQGELAKDSCVRAGDNVTKSAESAGANVSKVLDGPKPDSKAMQECREDAEKGDPKAQYTLGICYRDGAGVPKDLKQAKYWLEKAAKQGHDMADAALKNLK